jgi:hypothetical protein
MRNTVGRWKIKGVRRRMKSAIDPKFLGDAGVG